MTLTITKQRAAGVGDARAGYADDGDAAHIVKKVVVYGLRNAASALQRQYVAPRGLDLLTHGQLQLRWRPGHGPVV